MDWIHHDTYWMATTNAPAMFPRLRGNRNVDVAIIGGGITGLTTALHLKSAGRKVVVLEAGRIGAGTTGGTSAHLDAMPDQGVSRLVRDHGEEPARTVTAARMAAISQIEAWSGAVAGDCEFVRVPSYLFSESNDGAERIFEQLEVVRSLGLQADVVRDLKLPFSTGGGLRIEKQARFHPLKYLFSLAKRFHGDGCEIFEHTRAEPPKDGAPCTIKTEGGEISALDVVLCTHSSFLGISELDMRVAPYQSYVITVSLDEEFPDALFWDDASPYHYLRRASQGKPGSVIIGGADHKTGQGGNECESFRTIEAYARERLAVRSIDHQWSAEYFEPADGLPFVGRVPMSKNLYVATGFSGTGLTFGTLSGRLLADLLLQQQNPLADILTPSRIKPLASVGNLLSENLNVAKRFVADRLRPQSIENLNDISVGCGKVVHFKGETVAAYRDENGSAHLVSPKCTHAGCYVQWNEAETTWDCPCHGGRFSATGERLYGPPPSDLKSMAHLL